MQQEIKNSNLIWNKNKWDKTKIYSIMIIIITIILTFYVLSDLYSWYNLQKLEKENIENKIASLNTELNVLNEKNEKVKNDKETLQLIKQFAWEYREDIILDQIYIKFDWVSIWDINMDKWQKLPNWLSMASVSFNIGAKDIETLNWYLDYLTWKKSNIRFVIKSIAVPLNTEKTDSMTKASLNLWMYYFDNK